MKNTIFNTSAGSFPVSHIVYASGVWEIPEDKRRSDRTHGFKIVTSTESASCYFRSFDAAVSARNALGAMIAHANPHAFRHGHEVVDARRIVSIGDTVKLKTPQGESTHAVILGLDTHDERSGKLWLKFKSEEAARKVRRMLFAVVAATHDNGTEARENDNGTSADNGEQGTDAEIGAASVVAECGASDLPF
jgi:hypothetical protein